MSWSRAAVESGPEAQTLAAFPHSGLIKRDRPRSIDRYIDYFGDGSRTSSTAETARLAEAGHASDGGRRQ